MDDARDPDAPTPLRRAIKLAVDLTLGAGLIYATFAGFTWLRTPDLPEVAPAFTLADLDGQRVSLADYEGRTVVLNFWSPWCGPCRTEIPEFSEFAQANPEVAVLGIAVDGRPDQLRAEARRLGVEYPVLVASREVMDAYDANVLPTTVIVDGQGKVSSVHVGAMSERGLRKATSL